MLERYVLGEAVLDLGILRSDKSYRSIGARVPSSEDTIGCSLEKGLEARYEAIAKSKMEIPAK